MRFSFGYQSPGATLHRQACGFTSGGADFVPRHCGLSGEHALRRCEGWRQHGQPLQAMETPVSLIPPEWGGRWGALCERAAHLAFSSGIPDLLTSRANCPGLLRDPLFLHHTQLLRLLVVLALCCLLTFAFLVVFVPCLFPLACILVSIRLELEPWVLLCFWCYRCMSTEQVLKHLDSLLPCKMERVS